MQRSSESSTVHIEFCRACQLHNWCTHHDQQKYLTYFHRISKYLTKNFTNLQVSGNEIPQHYAPVTGQDNKFYDLKTQKYINFPEIGSFEITFRDELLFSKKQTNTWPDFRQIKQKINQTMNGNDLEAKKKFEKGIKASLEESQQQNNIEGQITDKDTEVFKTHQILDDDKRATFYKSKKNKNFTLTDHFKIYKMQQQQQQRKQMDGQLLSSRNQKSMPQIKSKGKQNLQNERTSRKQWTNSQGKTNIVNYIKKKANQNDGKKQMIIDLDRIEQETFIDEMTGARKENERKNSRQMMKQWNQELNFLQNKFQRVESSLSKIREGKKEFDNGIPQISSGIIQKNKQQITDVQKGISRQTLFPKFTRSPNQSRTSLQHPFDPITKNHKIDEYMQSSSAQKTRKLHQIYGEWRVYRPQNEVESKYMKYSRKNNDSPNSSQEEWKAINTRNNRHQRLEKLNEGNNSSEEQLDVDLPETAEIKKRPQRNSSKQQLAHIDKLRERDQDDSKKGNRKYESLNRLQQKSQKSKRQFDQQHLGSSPNVHRIKIPKNRSQEDDESVRTSPNTNRLQIRNGQESRNKNNEKNGSQEKRKFVHTSKNWTQNMKNKAQKQKNLPQQKQGLTSVRTSKRADWNEPKGRMLNRSPSIPNNTIMQAINERKPKNRVKTFESNGKDSIDYNSQSNSERSPRAPEKARINSQFQETQSLKREEQKEDFENQITDSFNEQNYQQERQRQKRKNQNQSENKAIFNGMTKNQEKTKASNNLLQKNKTPSISKSPIKNSTSPRNLATTSTIPNNSKSRPKLNNNFQQSQKNSQMELKVNGKQSNQKGGKNEKERVRDNLQQSKVSVRNNSIKERTSSVNSFFPKNDLKQKKPLKNLDNQSKTIMPVNTTSSNQRSHSTSVNNNSNINKIDQKNKKQNKIEKVLELTACFKNNEGGQQNKQNEQTHEIKQQLKKRDETMNKKTDEKREEKNKEENEEEKEEENKEELSNCNESQNENNKNMNLADDNLECNEIDSESQMISKQQKSYIQIKQGQKQNQFQYQNPKQQIPNIFQVVEPKQSTDKTNSIKQQGQSKEQTIQIKQKQQKQKKVQKDQIEKVEQKDEQGSKNEMSSQNKTFDNKMNIEKESVMNDDERKQTSSGKRIELKSESDQKNESTQKKDEDKKKIEQLQENGSQKQDFRTQIEKQGDTQIIDNVSIREQSKINQNNSNSVQNNDVKDAYKKTKGQINNNQTEKANNDKCSPTVENEQTNEEEAENKKNKVPVSDDVENKKSQSLKSEMVQVSNEQLKKNQLEDQNQERSDLVEQKRQNTDQQQSHNLPQKQVCHQAKEMSQNILKQAQKVEQNSQQKQGKQNQITQQVKQQERVVLEHQQSQKKEEGEHFKENVQIVYENSQIRINTAEEHLNEKNESGVKKQVETSQFRQLDQHNLSNESDLVQQNFAFESQNQKSIQKVQKGISQSNGLCSNQEGSIRQLKQLKLEGEENSKEQQQRQNVGECQRQEKEQGENIKRMEGIGREVNRKVSEQEEIIGNEETGDKSKILKQIEQRGKAEISQQVGQKFNSNTHSQQKNTDNDKSGQNQQMETKVGLDAKQKQNSNNQVFIEKGQLNQKSQTPNKAEQRINSDQYKKENDMKTVQILQTSKQTNLSKIDNQNTTQNIRQESKLSIVKKQQTASKLTSSQKLCDNQQNEHNSSFHENSLLKSESQISHSQTHDNKKKQFYTRQNFKNESQEKKQFRSTMRSKALSKNTVNKSQFKQNEYETVEMISVGVQKHETTEIGFQIHPDFVEEIETFKEQKVQKYQRKQNGKVQVCIGLNEDGEEEVKQIMRHSNVKSQKNKANQKLKNENRSVLKGSKVMKNGKANEKLSKSQQFQQESVVESSKQEQKQNHKNSSSVNQSNVLKSQIKQKISQKIEEQKLPFSNNESKMKQSKMKNSSVKNSQRTSNNVEISEEEEEMQDMIVERAKITEQLYGSELDQQKQVFSNLNKKMKNVVDFSSEQKSKYSWKSLQKIFPKVPLFNKNSTNACLTSQNDVDLSSFRKSIGILGHLNEYLIIRLFENRNSFIGQPQKNLYGIWLCDHYSWRCFVVDDKIPVNGSNQPIHTVFSQNSGQLAWLYLLEKAVALCLGGYQKLKDAEVGEVMHLLTGSNIMSFKVREDPNKNEKLFAAIKGCSGKNFFMHCQKSQSSIQALNKSKINKKLPIFRIESVKTVQKHLDQQNQKVIQICEIKGREENKFWMKFDKFVQQFRLVQIVQLRMNHNTCQLTVNNFKGTFEIVVLEFKSQCFGSISLSKKTKAGFMKIHLYKEEQSNTLKLVGEAKQKSKNQLFCDCLFSAGKYFVFVEVQAKGNSTICYSGQGYPNVFLKQEVKVDGYRNDYTEYVPIFKKNNKENNIFPSTVNSFYRADKQNSELSMTKIKNGSSTRLKLNNQLRENFINFLVEGEVLNQ